MSSNAPDPTPHKKGGLWARLFGMEESGQAAEKKESKVTPPEWDTPLAPQASMPEPLGPEVEATPAAAVAPVPEPPPPVTTAANGGAAVSAPPVPAPPAERCPICQSPRKDGHQYCDDCGYMYGPPGTNAGPAAAAPPASAAPQGRIRERYEIDGLLSERSGISRYQGRDLGGPQPVPVVIVCAALPAMVEPEAIDVPLSADGDDEGSAEDIMPTFEDAVPVAAVTGAVAWPSLGWERNLLEPDHPALPRLLDAFAEGGFDYLIEELPQGRVLWDAWDEPAADAPVRYRWLKQIAEGLVQLHQGGAVAEGLRPDHIIVDDANQARIADLSGLLPVPVPSGTPVRDNLYTAPELVMSPDQADARADLYSMGAMLYSLEYLHHALEEKDFERPFAPHQITDRYPDAHPGLCRLVNKTFCRDLNTRFPTDEAGKQDATGFRELINTLEVCARTFDNPRMDIAAWVTTGMVRTGNEDAFAFLHAVTASQDDLGEHALILLCDGMGGYEAGEIAAAMCIASLRKYLLEQPMFAALAGKEPPAGPVDIDACKKILVEALRHANKEVFTASRTPGGKGRRGMGCTAEAVYIDQKNIVVGHVGDSRTYHLRSGRLVQLTRDQTLVNRLVELGTLTPEEAEDHPRKNELQQAIGGQPDVEPGVYSSKLTRGDWVLVCSDGLTNHVPSADIEKMLLRETAGSAEEAARRFLNLVNLRGATDNSAVVVMRAV
jgi:serine/threonine protein phosphatase PrpC